MSPGPARTLERGGEYFRVADPDWADPLDGSFAARRGGRWNPPDSFPVVYLAATVAVARANVYRKLEGQPFGPEDLEPHAAPVLVTAEVPAADYLDAITDEGLRALGLPARYPTDEEGEPVGWDRCQPVGRASWDRGDPGIACRSAAPAMADHDEELAWFQRVEAPELVRVRVEGFEGWFWG